MSRPSMPGGSRVGQPRPDPQPGGTAVATGPGIVVPLPPPSQPPTVQRPPLSSSSGSGSPLAIIAPPAVAQPRPPARLPVGRAAPIAPAAPPVTATGPLAARVAAPAAAAAGGAALVASNTSWWNHNQSVMRLDAQQEAVRFYYETPRRGLSDLGIKPGTLLFDGKNTGGNGYAGTVTTFSRKCGDVTFPVTGEATSDGNRLVVTGMKPNRDRNCRVTSQRSETLMFELRSAAR